jgi:hypothetical protein
MSMRAGRFVVALVSLVGLSSGALAVTDLPRAHAAEDAEVAVTKAEVELKILETDGAQVELPEHDVSLGTDAEIVAQSGGHEHKIKMRVSAGSSAETVRLALGYERDGSTVIARKEIDARSHAPSVLSSKDGKIKVEVTVKPKAPHKIDMPGGNGPLDGL